MEDKRQFGRWFREGEDVAVVSCAEVKDKGQIIDVSAGGMRVNMHKPVNVGETVYGQFKVMDFPYYVKGHVNRVMVRGQEWEVAISFDKVSSIPIGA